MRDDKVQLLIMLAVLTRIAQGHGAAVEHMAEAAALDVDKAGDLGDVCQLAGRHGVVDIGGDAERRSDLAGQQAAEVRGVRLAEVVVHKGMAQVFVHKVAARLQAEDKAAAANNGCKLLRMHAAAVEKIADDGQTHRHLIADAMILLQCSGIMLQILLQKLLRPVVERQLRAGGAGIDDQKLHSAFSSRLLLISAQTSSE